MKADKKFFVILSRRMNDSPEVSLHQRKDLFIDH